MTAQPPTPQPPTPRALPTEGPDVTVLLPVPDLARLRPSRRSRYRAFLACWFATFLTLGVAGMLTDDNRFGGPAVVVMLVGAGWLVVRDLRVRAVDDREYERLARHAAELLAPRLGAPVPPQAMFALLGGGIERTGNPWRPTRDRGPRDGGVSWTDGTGARYAATVHPIPLPPNGTATVTAGWVSPRPRSTWDPSTWDPSHGR